MFYFTDYFLKLKAYSQITLTRPITARSQKLSRDEPVNFLDKWLNKII